MHKLALAAALAAATLISGPSFVSSAYADGYGYHRHHHHWRHYHRWGNNDFDIVRWVNGDCKIWHDDNGPPVGTDWVVMAEDFPTWGAAWTELVWLQDHGQCTR
jgi:hypothetical protein